MKVSCLMVTQESRWEHFQRACRCFLRQTWPDKELVVAAYGSAEFRERLTAYCRELPAPTVLAMTPEPSPLGQLRNLSVQAATGDVICQWDDDDEHHPQRVEIQARALLDQSADFCLLADYWHFFADTGELYWVDCRHNAVGKPWPTPHLQTLHGTLTARRAAMLPYTRQSRAEDSRLLLYALIKRLKLVSIQGMGWCYVYVYHGGNTWERQHHDEYVRNRQRVRLFPPSSDSGRLLQSLFHTSVSVTQLLSEYEFGSRISSGKAA